MQNKIVFLFCFTTAYTYRQNFCIPCILVAFADEIPASLGLLDLYCNVTAAFNYRKVYILFLSLNPM